MTASQEFRALVPVRIPMPSGARAAHRLCAG